MTKRWAGASAALLFGWWMSGGHVVAEHPPAQAPRPEHREDLVDLGIREEPDAERGAATSDWHYGGFVDLGYSLDFNFPANHLFRNRGTTPRVNELDLNMGGASVRKDATEQSRWGMELMGQGGQDARGFGFHANQPKVGSSDQLRHFGWPTSRIWLRWETG